MLVTKRNDAFHATIGELRESEELREKLVDYLCLSDVQYCIKYTCRNIWNMICGWFEG